MKTCTKCGLTQPTSNFSKDKSKTDHLSSNCRSCRRAYRVKNIEHIKARDKAFYEANKEHIKKVKALYRARNKEEILRYSKAHYQKNKDRILKLKKEYKRKGREELTDVYIRRLIKRSSTWFLDTEDIPQSLIETTRMQIILERKIKDYEK